jgi:hypothetical protein
VVYYVKANTRAQHINIIRGNNINREANNVGEIQIISKEHKYKYIPFTTQKRRGERG